MNEAALATTETIAPIPLEVPIERPADAPDEWSDARQAAKFVADRREARLKEAANINSSAESAPQATAEPQLSGEDNAAQLEEAVTGETQEDAPAEPQRDLPRSWTKDRTEVWNRLDPATQDILLEQDRKASAEVRRVQNEAAEMRKAAEAERKAAEQARQDWLNKVPAIEDIQRFVAQGPFADIKSQDDLDQLAMNDPLRYLQWDAYQKRLAGMAEQANQAKALKEQERNSTRNSYEAEQTKLLMELVPEFTDSKKLSAARDNAIPAFESRGVSVDLLREVMGTDAGHKLLNSAGFQKLVYDAMRSDEIQNAAKVAAAKPVPPVQRPGTKPVGNGSASNIQAISAKLTQTGSARDAARLLAAKRAARSR